MVTKEEIANGYDKIAEKIYVSDDFYNEVIAIEKNWYGVILDAGCGQGPILEKLRNLGKSDFLTGSRTSKILRLVGIDISDKLLEMAQQKIPEAEIIKADIDNMPFPDNLFDFAVMVDVFQYLCQKHDLHLSTPRVDSVDKLSTRGVDKYACGFIRALNEIYRVLKPGGKLIVTVPNKNWLLFDEYIKRRKNIQPVEDYFFTFEEMAGLLRKHGFKIEDYRGADCFRYYAPYHKYEIWLAVLIPWMHKHMKKIIFKAQK